MNNSSQLINSYLMNWSADFILAIHEQFRKRILYQRLGNLQTKSNKKLAV